MTYLLATLSLFIIVAMAIWARWPEKDTPVKSDGSGADKPFVLKKAILLIGPALDDGECREQRNELKRILPPLMADDYRIIEVYGTQPPAQNGEIYHWLDNQLLRDTLNADKGFHLIFLGQQGEMLFHGTRPVTAEALLHIFDLWHHIEGDAGEVLANAEPEAAPALPSPQHTEEKPHHIAAPATRPAGFSQRRPANSLRHKPSLDTVSQMHQSRFHRQEPRSTAGPELSFSTMHMSDDLDDGDRPSRPKAPTRVTRLIRQRLN